MNAVGHLTQASELHHQLVGLDVKLSYLCSLLRLARDMDFEALSSDADVLEDLCNAVYVIADMAATAKESCGQAVAQACGLSARMEGKPEPGDSIPTEALAEMFEALACRGKGSTPYQLSCLASMLGAYAQQDPALKPAFEIWVAWMRLTLEIKTAVDEGAKERTGKFCLYATSAPGGIHAPIGAATTGDLA